MTQMRLFNGQDVHDPQLTRHANASPFDILCGINWDFNGEATQYLTHTFHSYPARFIPQIPNTLINLFSSVGDMILDPFMGCGTTLVEAMLLNRRAIGVDMNPLACLIGRAKTTLVDQHDLMHLWAATVRMPCGSNRRDDDDGAYSSIARGTNGADVILPERKISHLFTPTVIAELQDIKDHIETLRHSESLLNIALVALSSTIRVIVESKRQDGILRVFRQKIKAMTCVLQEMKTHVSDSDVRIVHGDARRLTLSDESVALVVTSPPYVNAIDYYRVHQYNMAWLGMDYTAFQRQEIGGHSHFIANRFRLLSEYLADMLRSMIEMSRVLLPSGICAIVIGNSSLEFELIESHRFFATMAEDVGFTLRRLLFRSIDTSRKYHNQKIGKIDNEHIVVLQKVTHAPTTSDDDEFVANVVRREMERFRKQVADNPGSSLRGKKVSAERLRANAERLDAAIATIREDIKIKR